MTTDSMPLVTVIVTSYNHQDFVSECIQSIIRQTYKNIELIVIDDGSPDESQEIIKALSNEYGFQFVTQKNQGIATVLNKGIELAKGKYFISIGSDDVCMLDRVEKQVRFMELNPDVAICGGNQIVIDEFGSPAEKQRFSSACKLNFEEIFCREGPGIKAPTAMVRLDVLNQVGGYDPGIKLEDIYMWLKITKTGFNAYILEDVLSYYRKHGNNQSKNIGFMADNLEKIYSDYKNHPKHKKIIKDLLINLTAKGVRRGYPNSISLLKRVSLAQYNLKIIGIIILWIVKFEFVRYKKDSK